MLKENLRFLNRPLLIALCIWFCPVVSHCQSATYVPTAENLKHREAFEDYKFGIFIHWGIYSQYAQGEWYLNSGLNGDEYAKAADAFYPHRFDARTWAKAIREAGAKYITFTSRHHDGFSMWNTGESDYNIVDGTPYGRDVVAELAEACHAEGIALHLYYSILDWRRTDYPVGRTGLRTGRALHPDYDRYMGFMKRQLKELLTRYGDIGALWFDGYWDHDADTIPFDWRMPELYSYLHALKPSLLIGNNHHLSPIEGEDFQMFERDLPGENHAGLSGQQIGQLPLEMCQTMNGMWGYKVSDTNYKSVDELVTLLVRAVGKGSNLLLNIGPQPNGELPAQSLERLQGMGQWLKQNGASIYGTRATSLGEQPWGTTAERGDSLFLHVLNRDIAQLTIPLPRKPQGVALLGQRERLLFRYDRKAHNLVLDLPKHAEEVDLVVVVVR